jgi:hypothetical protein
MRALLTGLVAATLLSGCDFCTDALCEPQEELPADEPPLPCEQRDYRIDRGDIGVLDGGSVGMRFHIRKRGNDCPKSFNNYLIGYRDGSFDLEAPEPYVFDESMVSYEQSIGGGTHVFEDRPLTISFGGVDPSLQINIDDAGELATLHCERHDAELSCAQ